MVRNTDASRVATRISSLTTRTAIDCARESGRVTAFDSEDPAVVV